MTKLVALFLAATAFLSPVLARADQDLADGTGGTYDCAADGVVNINNSSASYTLIGACTQVNLNGSDLHVTIADVDAVAVQGSGNQVKLGAVDTILVNGDRNSVRWQKGKSSRKPSIAANGSENSIGRQR